MIFFLQKRLNKNQPKKKNMGGVIKTKKKKYENMTPKEKIEYAKKRAERSDKISTFSLVFVATCSVMTAIVGIIAKFY